MRGPWCGLARPAAAPPASLSVLPLLAQEPPSCFSAVHQTAPGTCFCGIAVALHGLLCSPQTHYPRLFCYLSFRECFPCMEYSIESVTLATAAFLVWTINCKNFDFDFDFDKVNGAYIFTSSNSIPLFDLISRTGNERMPPLNANRSQM